MQSETTVGGERKARKPEQEKRESFIVGGNQNAKPKKNGQWSIMDMDYDEHNKEGDLLTITDPLEIKIAETFNRKPLAALANGDAKLREMRGCIINKDEEICRKLGQYYHQHWNDMNVKRGILVVDEKIAIQN